MARRWCPAVLLATSARDDLAVLGLNCSEPLECVPLAAEPAAVGDVVTLLGVPGGGELRREASRVVEHRYREIELVVGTRTYSGQSGGAILNARGELVGVISGTAPARAPNHTLASGVVAMRRLLASTFRAGVPACIAEIPAEPTPTPDEPGETPAEREEALLHEIAALREELIGLRTRLAAVEGTVIPVEILSPSGQVIESQSVPLGRPIQLRLVPRTTTPEARSPPRSASSLLASLTAARRSGV